MLIAIAELISNNTHLAEIAPGFISIELYLYYGLVYYYQILRAKNDVGYNQLNRIETAVLRIFRTIGEPEDWPIASPMIEFIRALGYIKSANPEYSYIVPKFPNFARLTQGATANQGLRHLTEPPGIERIPPIPAYIEFLHRIPSEVATYRPVVGWTPIDTDDGHLDADHSFLGLTNSTANEGLALQALTLNHGWKKPQDNEFLEGPIQIAAKRQIISQWEIPSALGNYSDLATWTRLTTDTNITWLTRLISMMANVNRFFPGSTHLGAIDPVSHVGNLTQIDAKSARDYVRTQNRWYLPRDSWSINYTGYDSSKEGHLLARTGIATGIMLQETAAINPISALSRELEGPFFLDNPNEPILERHEIFRFEGESEQDPTLKFGEQLASLYDPHAGRHQ